MLNWLKSLWESNKSKLIKKLSVLLDSVVPFVAGKIHEAGKGNISMETAEAAAKDIINALKNYIEKQL